MSQTIRLSLPFPPSVWELYEGAGKKRHRSRLYNKWLEDVGFFIRKRGADTVSQPFCIAIALKRPSNRSDLDNRAKAILDALQHYGVIKNDNLCERLTMQWDQGMKEECVVILIPAEESLAA